MHPVAKAPVTSRGFSFISLRFHRPRVYGPPTLSKRAFVDVPVAVRVENRLVVFAAPAAEKPIGLTGGSTDKPDCL